MTYKEKEQAVLGVLLKTIQPMTDREIAIASSFPKWSHRSGLSDLLHTMKSRGFIKIITGSHPRTWILNRSLNK